jgi:hypothetical protein
MARERTYSDEQLVIAVSTSRSWRGVLRALGLVATSAGAMRSVRSNADRLGIDYSHFKGQRRWTEEELGAAVEAATNWVEVLDILGIQSVSALATVKGHASRIGLDLRHLTVSSDVGVVRERRPDTAYLRRAGPLLAASWFTLCGRDVSWPLEPSRYDLVVCGEEGLRRVQVKTTTTRAGNTWKVYLSTARRERKTYDPDEIDDFFVIDGSLMCYLIPMAVVGGLQAVHLAGYGQYRLATIGSWFGV